MREKKISWWEQVSDTRLDQGHAVIEEVTGNRGLGLIVFALCGLAIVMSVVGSILSMKNGSLIVHPSVPVLFALVFLGGPTYWGLNQFFLRRRYVIDNKVISFELFSLARWRKIVKVPIEDYGQVEYGYVSGTESTDAWRHSSSGYYFVRLPHATRRLQITLYRDMREQISERRLERYSHLLGLPLTDLTPDHVPAEERFGRLVEERMKRR
jgi:hypothetical protein